MEGHQSRELLTGDELYPNRWQELMIEPAAVQPVAVPCSVAGGSIRLRIADGKHLLGRSAEKPRRSLPRDRKKCPTDSDNSTPLSSRPFSICSRHSPGNSFGSYERQSNSRRNEKPFESSLGVVHFESIHADAVVAFLVGHSDGFNNISDPQLSCPLELLW